MAQLNRSVSRLIFSKDTVLISTEAPHELPQDGKIDDFIEHADSTIVFDAPDENKYSGVFYHIEKDPPAGYTFIPLRSYAHTVEPEVFTMVSRAYQLLYWDATHKFCGKCGSPLSPDPSEHAKTCGSCGLQIFPQIAPAIIIGIINEGKLLLAHNSRFPTGLYSLVAGFMEPGETIEATASREVFEEIGIHIQNIRYFGSQPWPFPHSLMIGLLGEYASGEVTPDGEEITDARWFSPADLPDLPGPGSISRKIIDWYIDTHS